MARMTEKQIETAIREMDEFVSDMQDEDLRLRELAKTDPEYARLMADADAAYEAKYGHPWVNPKSA